MRGPVDRLFPNLSHRRRVVVDWIFTIIVAVAIVLAVGAAGALLSLIFWSSWGGVGGPADGGPRGRRTVVRDDY